LGAQNTTTTALAIKDKETTSSPSRNAVATTAGAVNSNLLRETVTTTGGKPQSLTQRIKFLQSQLAHAPMPSITSKRRQLPSIEEAWNLPISNEMSSRQQQSVQNQQRQYQKGGFGGVVSRHFFFIEHNSS
jgi:lysine-specific demethylase 6A